MNERILELIEQSKCLSDGYNTGAVDFEKFAELIVKKCISMADEFEMDVNRSGLVDKMKEYFGVEE